MKEFTIDFLSDMGHEHLMAEISFMGQRLCILDKENGNENMEIEFITDLYVLPESVRMKFRLSDFEDAIRAAREDLAKCQ